MLLGHDMMRNKSKGKSERRQENLEKPDTY